ncbi:MAG: hypothetical protein U9Q85_00950 [Patescibacteria group bacterium]|nr:hypothetical protein [Patescibacteria group bacterium]
MFKGKQKNIIPLTVLIFLDGWGIAPTADNNAISLSKTSYIDYLIENYPAGVLSALSKENISREEVYKTYGMGLGDFFHKKELRQCRIGVSENIALLSEFFDQGSFSLGAKYNIEIISKKIINNDLSEDTRKIKDVAVKIIKKTQADFIVLNFINADISVNFKEEELIKNISVIDYNIKQIIDSVLRQNGQVFIVGSFGRAEQHFDINTEKRAQGPSANPVPLIIVAEKYLGKNFSWPSPSGIDLSTVEPIGSITNFAPSLLSFLKQENLEFIIR